MTVIWIGVTLFSNKVVSIYGSVLCLPVLILFKEDVEPYSNIKTRIDFVIFLQYQHLQLKNPLPAVKALCDELLLTSAWMYYFQHYTNTPSCKFMNKSEDATTSE